MTKKIQRFLAEQRPPTPCLVMDLDMCGQGHDVCRTVEDWILHESYKNIYVFHLLLSGRWIIQ
jgi:hypothetical protein